MKILVLVHWNLRALTLHARTTDKTPHNFSKVSTEQNSPISLSALPGGILTPNGMRF